MTYTPDARIFILALVDRLYRVAKSRRAGMDDEQDIGLAADMMPLQVDDNGEMVLMPDAVSSHARIFSYFILLKALSVQCKQLNEGETVPLTDFHDDAIQDAIFYARLRFAKENRTDV